MILLFEKHTLTHFKDSFYTIIEEDYFQNLFYLNRSYANDNVFEKYDEECFELLLNSNFESKSQLVLKNYSINDILNNIYVITWSNYTIYNDFQTFNYIPDFESFKKNQSDFEIYFNIKFSKIEKINDDDFKNILFNDYIKVDEYILNILNENSNSGSINHTNHEKIIDVFKKIFNSKQKKILKLINFF